MCTIRAVTWRAPCYHHTKRTNRKTYKLQKPPPCILEILVIMYALWIKNSRNKMLHFRMVAMGVWEYWYDRLVVVICYPCHGPWSYFSRYLFSQILFTMIPKRNVSQMNFATEFFRSRKSFTELLTQFLYKELKS